MVFVYSFLILFLAEICGTLRDIFLLRKNKQMQALFNGIGSAMWCVKVVVVMSQPASIITGFFGAYFGSLLAFWIETKYIKTHGGNTTTHEFTIH